MKKKANYPYRIVKTPSYFDACKTANATIMQDLKDKGLTRNRIPADYPVSRRTLHTITNEATGKAEYGFISLETFGRIAAYFGITLYISFGVAKQGDSAVYDLLDNDKIDTTG